ncbi:hypothetical protein LguiA_002243 [Lonicera macranthoides]
MHTLLVGKKKFKRVAGDAGDVRLTDTRADEAEHEMTPESLKSYKRERNGNEYLINLIDSPGHVDFSSEAVDMAPKLPERDFSGTPNVPVYV